MRRGIPSLGAMVATGGLPHEAPSGVWNAVTIVLVAVFVVIAGAATVLVTRQNREERDLTKDAK
jgi:protein-S-isoprenylcysteine O-methyltransferase Ste14